MLFDVGSRALYAADASNYRQLPIGVILPRDARMLRPRSPRAALSAQRCLPRGRRNQPGRAMRECCGGLRLFALHERAVRRSILTRSWRVVEPGIVLDRLRDAAEKYHLTYAPDPATHSRCTLGGMIGNNSCGVHGLLGGKVVDNVE